MAIGKVILVPGIGGNELYTPASLFGYGPKLRVWLDYVTIVGGGWRLLGLASDGITPSVPLAGPLEPGGPLPPYYALMGDRLRRLGWNVIGAKLDWRGTVARDATRLAALIAEEGATEPVRVIAHSRGGLVLRAALAQLLASGQLGRVGRCLGLGVPHRGAWAAAGLPGLWNETVTLLTLLVERTPGVAGVGSVFGPLDKVIWSWPATYELLPQPGAPQSDPYQIEQVYNPSTWFAIKRNVDPVWLVSAKSAWGAIPDVPTAVTWVDAVGYGVLTPTALANVEALDTPQAMTYSEQGDGTVPMIWATQPGRRRINTPTSHNAMCFDGRLISAIDDYLRNGLDHDITIEGGILL